MKDVYLADLAEKLIKAAVMQERKRILAILQPKYDGTYVSYGEWLEDRDAISAEQLAAINCEIQCHINILA